MDENKKDLMKDENYVLENITQEIEMIKDNTIPSPENALKEEEFIVETVKVEESVEVPVVTSVNTAPITTEPASSTPSEETVIPTVTEPVTNETPVVDTVNTDASEIVANSVTSEEPKKKSKLPLILLLILLLGGACGGVFFMTQGNSNKEEPKKEEKKKEEPPVEKEEEIEVYEISTVVSTFVYDDPSILEGESKCGSGSPVFFKDKTVTLKDISDEIIASYVIGYARNMKSTDCASEMTDCISDGKLTITDEEYKLFATHLFGDKVTPKFIEQVTNLTTVCIYDKDNHVYNCTNDKMAATCIYSNASYEIAKASKKGDTYNAYLKVVFEKDGKFYSDYERTKEIEEVKTYKEAFEKLEEANYYMTFKKVSNHYQFVSASLVK